MSTSAQEIVNISWVNSFKFFVLLGPLNQVVKEEMLTLARVLKMLEGSRMQCIAMLHLKNMKKIKVEKYDVLGVNKYNTVKTSLMLS